MRARLPVVDRATGLPAGTEEVEDADLGPASVVALLVDDNEEDRKIAQRLTASGLQCNAIGPGESFDALVTDIEARADSGDADVVILDYRLDDAGPGGEQFPHRAGTLAAELKEHRPLLPLVLLTTEVKLQQWLFRTPQVHSLFDLLVLKPETTTAGRRTSVVLAVEDLTAGFRDLEGRYHETSGWTQLRALLGTTPEELEDLMACFPSGPPAGAADAANWLLRLLLDRPGPLLPLEDAAARLGVTAASFRQNLSAVKALRYEGPFWRLRPRWWRGRLARVEDIDSASPPLEAATCRVCEEQPVSRACTVCRIGIDLRHGVRVHEDASLAWAEPQLVCYDCIAEGRAEHIIFPRGVANLVDELRAGEGNAV